MRTPLRRLVTFLVRSHVRGVVVEMCVFYSREKYVAVRERACLNLAKYRKTAYLRMLAPDAAHLDVCMLNLVPFISWQATTGLGKNDRISRSSMRE